MPASAPNAPAIRAILAWARTAQDNRLGSRVLQAHERLAGWARVIGRRFMMWVDACAATSAAAALHREFARLSDAELERRGIPRGELHRCVFEALDGPSANSAADGNRKT
jgi:hypothetical protein